MKKYDRTRFPNSLGNFNFCIIYFPKKKYKLNFCETFATTSKFILNKIAAKFSSLILFFQITSKKNGKISFFSARKVCTYTKKSEQHIQQDA